MRFGNLVPAPLRTFWVHKKYVAVEIRGQPNSSFIGDHYILTYFGRHQLKYELVPSMAFGKDTGLAGFQNKQYRKDMFTGRLRVAAVDIINI
jgi:hypothetical protein